MRTEKNELTNDYFCPSAPCSTGAVLLGIVKENGRVAFFEERIIVGEEFVNAAQLGRSPEKRFRFAARCIGHGCKQWQNDKCGVVDYIVEARKDDGSGKTLPKCVIRSNCRWFHQHGTKSCVTCPDVITDLT